MEMLLDAICVVDSAGFFVSVNGACERIFGYPSAEMVGQPMLNFVYHEDRQRTIDAVARIVAGHVQLHFENRYVRKNGQLVNIEWTARWSEELQVRVAVAREVSAHASTAVAEQPDAAHWRLSSAPARLFPPGFPPVALSGQDYLVLRALATGGDCVTRVAIVEALGQDFLDYDQRRLDTQIRRLRRKVEQACGLTLPLATLRGIGFRLYHEIELIK